MHRVGRIDGIGAFFWRNSDTVRTAGRGVIGRLDLLDKKKRLSMLGTMRSSVLDCCVTRLRAI